MSERLRLTSILFPLSLALAWSFDYLFWGKVDGVSFPIFVALCLVAGFWLARSQGVKGASRSLWLLLPIAFFATMSILRMEGFSLFLSRALALLLMAVLALSFIGGRWPEYGLADYIAKLAAFIPAGLGGYRQLRREPPKPGEKALEPSTFKAIGTGLLLSLPLLLLLGALLASADQYFARWLGDVFSFLDIDNLGEYLFRAFYIVVLAYLLVGVFVYALTRSQDKKLIGEDKPLVAPFLGFTETVTVLVSVELLFLAFVAIQFRYFFGGGANVTTATYTYAEYARRGFGEMIAVVVISIALFAALSVFSERKQEQQNQWFALLGIGLLALVAVMLVSAYQRLLLYESAYGFTRTRFYAHTFMIWLGLLLVALVVLEVQNRRRAFTLAAILAALGFAASLNLLNVDAFIVHANVNRALDGHRLDASYLGSLSPDALPQLLDEYQRLQDEGRQTLSESVVAAIACQGAINQDYDAPQPWQSFNLSRAAARRAWAKFQASDAFQSVTLPTVNNDLTSNVRVAGREFGCQSATMWD